MKHTQYVLLQTLRVRGAVHTLPIHLFCVMPIGFIVCRSDHISHLDIIIWEGGGQETERELWSWRWLYSCIVWRRIVGYEFNGFWRVNDMWTVISWRLFHRVTPKRGQFLPNHVEPHPRQHCSSVSQFVHLTTRNVSITYCSNITTNFTYICASCS
jgi:hypothetical protein